MESLESIDVHRECEKSLDLLRSLIQIHAEIDPPCRKVEAEEPDWILRLRKVCLHAVAITKCEIDVDGVHVMATELRFEADGDWWANQAKDGLAGYNHPTMFGLVMPLAEGGFSNAEAPESYLRLAVWIGRLGCGYGLALGYLARVLGVRGEIDSRLESAMSSAR